MARCPSFYPYTKEGWNNHFFIKSTCNQNYTSSWTY